MGWFLVAASVAVAFVVFGALAEKSKTKKMSITSLIVRSALTLVSLLIWATAMPGSWPYGWNAIRDMGAAYGLLLVPVAGLFTVLAELLTEKLHL